MDAVDVRDFAREACVPMPVSLTRRGAVGLPAAEYLFSEKTDGQRAHLCFSAAGRVECLDRRLRPRADPPALRAPDLLHAGTVLDCERMEEDGSYVVFDAWLACGLDLSPLPFVERLRAAEELASLIRPAGRVRRKAWSPAASLRLAPGAEGVIAARRDAALREKGGVLKIKPAERNTVDLVRVRRGRWADAAGRPFPMRVEEEEEGDHAAEGDAAAPIFEVAPPVGGGCGAWRVLGPRADKTRANGARAVDDALQAWREGLSLSECLAAWAAAEMRVL
ncbi:MAG: hypothetical protein VYE77_00940 [Planctomycetota bacterium]|nr:hypothetical protein [Planctomycetota bacterium]